MTPGDPVIGSTVLRRPAIQSPNYSAGAAGWTINADGSAEFNNLTIRGTFQGTEFVLNSSGAFFYSPSEAAGNLVASVAQAAGTDAYGNAYLSGVVSYLSGTPYAALQLNGGAIVWWTATTEAGPWTFNSVQIGTNAADATNLVLEAATISLEGSTGVTITGTLTVNGSTSTGLPSPNSTSTNGVSSPGTVGTSGPASAGTAHTHSAGSYSLGSGQHSHDIQNHEHPLLWTSRRRSSSIRLWGSKAR